MEAWSVGFQGLNPDVTLNYNPLGSGDGRTQFIEGGTLFAGTDSYFSDDEGELTAANERCGADIIEVPAYVSPIAVMFNLEGVDSLNLDSDTIAQIFDQKIKKWNDPAIADQNPDVELPDAAITTVHRQDDSGTTKNFTDYLGKASKSWSYEAEDAFPVKGGVAAEGTSGVVAAVTNGKGTIGYADDSQVKDAGLSVVNVKVGEEYVAPSAEAAAKVVAVSPAAEGRADTDMAVDVDRTTDEAGAYPVILLSYLVACQTYDTADEADLVKGFLELRRLRRGPVGRRRERRLGSARRRHRVACPGHRRGDRRQVAPRRRKPPRHTCGGRDPARRTSAPPDLTSEGPPLSSTSATAPPAGSAPTQTGDRIFSGIARAAGLVILAALAGVFIFLSIEGIPGLFQAEDAYKGAGNFSGTSTTCSSERSSPPPSP